MGNMRSENTTARKIRIIYRYEQRDSTSSVRGYGKRRAWASKKDIPMSLSVFVLNLFKK